MPIVLFLAIAAAQVLPWGEAAFSRARANDRLILLSIVEPGCHECAVAEHPAFVSVRLDRHDFPGVAEAYLGWARRSGAVDVPVRMVLTPQLEPLALIKATGEEAALSARWKSEHDALIAEAGLNMRRMRLAGIAPLVPPDTPAQRARDGRALLRSANAEDHRRAFEILRAMTETSLFDSIGGGFHRAARDAEWRMPQFEKNLDDQATAALAYTEAWQLSGNPLFEDVARITLESIARDFRDPKGGRFFNGLGADSLVARRGPEMLEGGHYVWGATEIQRVLDRKLADRFIKRYGVSVDGNVPKHFDRRGDFAGRNVLAVAHPMTDAEAEKDLRRARDILFYVRSKRPPPTLDRRMITAHNALAISALARGGAAFAEKRWMDAAAQAARTYLGTKPLVRSTEVPAQLDDFTNLIQALLDAYEVSFDVRFIARAVDLQKKQDAAFWNGGKYVSDSDVPVAVRGLGAEPPDVSEVTAANLARLAAISGDESWIGRATPVKQVMIAGRFHETATQEILAQTRKGFSRKRMVFLVDTKSTRAALSKWMPYVADIVAPDNGAMATVCQDRKCRTPTSDQTLIGAWIE